MENIDISSSISKNSNTTQNRIYENSDHHSQTNQGRQQQIAFVSTMFLHSSTLYNARKQLAGYMLNGVLLLENCAA